MSLDRIPDDKKKQRELLKRQIEEYYSNRVTAPTEEQQSKPKPFRPRFKFTNRADDTFGFKNSGDDDMAAKPKPRKATPPGKNTTAKTSAAAPKKSVLPQETQTPAVKKPRQGFTSKIDVGAIKIRKNHPIQSGPSRSPWISLLAQLNIGDSFHVPNVKPGQLAYVRAKGKKMGITLVTVSEGNGTAVGRVAGPGDIEPEVEEIDVADGPDGL